MFGTAGLGGWTGGLVSVARTSSGNENYTAIERAVTEDSDPGREVRKQVVRESCSKGEVGGNSFHTTA